MGLNLGAPPVQDELDVVDAAGKPMGLRARFRLPWTQWFKVAHVITFDVQNSGPTVDRPTSDLYVGKPYFDADLVIPIWWNGSDWINAAGVVV